MLKLSELNIVTLSRNGGSSDLTITNYLESVFSLNMIFILVLPRIDGNGDTQQCLKGMLVVFLSNNIQSQYEYTALCFPYKVKSIKYKVLKPKAHLSEPQLHR